MKKHYKIVAVAGGILGLLLTLYQSWQVCYSMPLALLVLAAGWCGSYVIYVLWSSFVEILERLERLEGKSPDGTVRIRRQKGETNTGEETETDAEEVQTGFICPRCGKVQPEGTTFCRRFGMPMR